MSDSQYPRELNFADPNGRFRGPIDAPTPSFPTASPDNRFFVNMAEFQRFNIEVQMGRDQIESDKFAASVALMASFGVRIDRENPYTADIQLLAGMLAALGEPV